MTRILVISASAAIGTGFYLFIARAVKHQWMKDYVYSHQWLLHPNSICYWRAAMALLGFWLYFWGDFQALAILIFTFAAILDGVDGVVARACGLGTTWGEWLDPFCDKLTYLPPLLGFAYSGIISPELVWTLTVIELAGQFFARHLLKLMKSSGAANSFGKIKAIICFALVIFCALLDKHPELLTNIGDEVLLACVVMATASIIFKFIPNRLYADILSTLNFCCGCASLFFTYEHRFVWAIGIIIVGQLFDLFDGRMALKHGGTKYGPYLDDIADFVSFGIAPAYVIITSGGGWMSWIFGGLYITGVAYRLIRFVVVDKKRTDLPEGIFNGLPSPAGALVVLGAALIAPPPVLWAISALSVGLMVSYIRFAHFGRVILAQIPKPLFFTASAAFIVVIAYVTKTRSVTMFGIIILTMVTGYMIAGRKFLNPPKS